MKCNVSVNQALMIVVVMTGSVYWAASAQGGVVTETLAITGQAASGKNEYAAQI